METLTGQGRPRLHLKPSKGDKLMELLAIGGTLFIWVYTIAQYANLPDFIPIHYNFEGHRDYMGRPDRWIPKELIWAFPAVTTVLVAILLMLARRPYSFNYPVEITEESAPRQYMLASRMLRAVAVGLTVVMVAVTVLTERKQGIGAQNVDIWILWSVLFLTVLPVLVYLYVASHGSKQWGH